MTSILKKPNGTKGFTIIELLIATSIFSLLLMIALAGFGGIGRLFYKGISITQTQSLTNQVITDITQNISNGAVGSVWTPAQNVNGYSYYCAGGVRYTFRLKYKLDPNQLASYGPSGNFVLLKDSVPGSSGCAAPCVSGCSAPFNNPSEMLGNRMRLMQLDIVNASGQLYNVAIKVAYGDDEQFSDVNDPVNINCQGGLSDQQFCAVDSLSATVYQGPN